MKNSMLRGNSLSQFWLPIIPVIFLLFACNSQPDNNQAITSPDGALQFDLQLDDQSGLSYSLKYQSIQVISKSPLGFNLEGGSQSQASVTNVSRKSVKSSWTPVYGERGEYPDIYNELLVEMEGVGFDLRVRAYDEGIAFRYEFSGTDSTKIKDELTSFSLSTDAMVWTSARAQSEIIESNVSSISEAVDRPLLAQISDSLFLAIGEAALVDFARMKFVGQAEKPGKLLSKLDGPVFKKGPFNTPWRFIMVGNTPGELLENNYLLLNLNEPSKIEDPSWTKPGKVIRETTLTTRGGLACVDFAVKHNLQFIEFDAGWYGSEYDDASDATTVTVDPKRSKGPLDLLEVIQYARDRDIGVLLYVNQRALSQQLDEILPLFKSWGVSGIKYGFVNVGSQEATTWLHEAVRKAAEHQLMIDIHDEYRPTGYSRTYPNLITQEGIRGDEESPTNSMVLKTLFTRMIAGAGDHTNCYFASRVEETMGSHASQLAKAVMIYSPWQFLYWYDRPEGSNPEEAGAGQTKKFIQEVPELAFFDALPTVWDDTKVLAGYPGEYAIIARRSRDEWFIGALNGDSPRSIEIPLAFLNGQYQAIIYQDDESVDTVTKVGISEREVSEGDVLKFDLKSNNGLAIHLRQFIVE